MLSDNLCSQLYERCLTDVWNPPNGGDINRIDADCRSCTDRACGADGSYRDRHSSRCRTGGRRRDRAAGDR
ncbi:hypothetical protein GCM10010448_11750 [Streptomyces glomeratus]|uniref:Uncharacterized protein n=1 Tax=Streptomyces glomeratus TaxID=284452 RepID=A0ABP6L3D5_9ACTN